MRKRHSEKDKEEEDEEEEDELSQPRATGKKTKYYGAKASEALKQVRVRWMCVCLRCTRSKMGDRTDLLRETRALFFFFPSPLPRVRLFRWDDVLQRLETCVQCFARQRHVDATSFNGFSFFRRGLDLLWPRHL
jgi:hypothetical protein